MKKNKLIASVHLSWETPPCKTLGIQFISASKHWCWNKLNYFVLALTRNLHRDNFWVSAGAQEIAKMYLYTWVCREGERAERERRGRKRKEGGILATGMFLWKHMVLTVLTALLTFGAGMSNYLDKLCLANWSKQAPLPACSYHGTVLHCPIPVSLAARHWHWVTVTPVWESANTPALILCVFIMLQTPKQHRKFNTKLNCIWCKLGGHLLP